jgi:hypothetical protein
VWHSSRGRRKKGGREGGREGGLSRGGGEPGLDLVCFWRERRERETANACVMLE